MDDAARDALELLTETVIGCAINVHRALGPGLLESIYSECLAIEIAAAKLRVQRERRVNLTYRGHRLARHLKLDLVVDDRLVIEVKAVERIMPVHLAQVITQLKLSGCPAGLLFNFHAITLKAGLRRLHHPDLYIRNGRPRF